MTPRRILTGCGLLAGILIVLIIGILIAPQIHLSFGGGPTTNASSNNNTPTTGITDTSGTSPTQLPTQSSNGSSATCPNDIYTGTGSINQSIIVPKGCGAVIIGYNGTVDSTSWGANSGNPGRVVAVGSGTHQVNIFQGAVYFTPSDNLKNKYCQTISNARGAGEADSTNVPLDQSWTC